MPFPIPKFTIEKKGFFDRFLHLSEHKDIDHVVYNDFPKDFVVKVENRKAMDDFLTEKFKGLIAISGLNHIESNGEALLIFNNNFKLAQLLDYVKMIQFADNLKKIINECEIIHRTTQPPDKISSVAVKFYHFTHRSIG